MLPFSLKTKLKKQLTEENNGFFNKNTRGINCYRLLPSFPKKEEKDLKKSK